MDKKVLEDMGFVFPDSIDLDMCYHGDGIRIRTRPPYEKYVLEVPGEVHALTINTKFDIEQLLKILGE